MEQGMQKGMQKGMEQGQALGRLLTLRDIMKALLQHKDYRLWQVTLTSRTTRPAILELP